MVYLESGIDYLSFLLSMKHQHEIDTRRTSIITMHIIGYEECGKPIRSLRNESPTPARSQLRPELEISKEASNLVTLTHLGEHENYPKTTTQGISADMIDDRLRMKSCGHY